MRLALRNSVVNLHLVPEMGALVYKNQMVGMYLVSVLRGFVGENKSQREVIAVVDYGATRFGGRSNVGLLDLIDFGQFFQTSV